MTIIKQIILEEVVCGTCGIPYAVPADWIKQRRSESGDIHCPNGCRRTWSESDADRLRKQLEARERELREAKCDALNKQHALELERQAKAQLERKLHRVSKGVCPCCKRSFQNLARHMATKHSGTNPPPEKEQKP